MALKRTRHTGKEPEVPDAFASSAGESELVARVGAYVWEDGDIAVVKNVAWGGNSNTETGGAYDGRNLLIHHIKVTNTNPDKIKELHFWSNNHTGRDQTHADYLFNIPVAKSKDDADGKLDTVIDFPIPLLVMGGCTLGVKHVAGSSGDHDEEVRAEICYTVLESSPDTASFDELKYKYLSAFDTYAAGSADGSSGGEFAIQPDTASTEWKEDIEIWGGMVLNYLNAGGSAATAKTYVKNADGNIVATISVLKGETNAFRLNFPVGIQWPTMTGSFALPTMPTLSGGSVNWPGIAPSGQSITFPTLSGGNVGSLPSIDVGHVIWADSNSKTKAQTAAAVTSSATVTLDSNTSSWMGDEIKVGDAVTDESGASKGTVATVTSQYNITLSASTSIDDDETLTFTRDDRKTWSLKAGGSDAQVTFYPYPVYCAGNAAGASNMKVYTGASGSNHTRGTWFYRPVKAQGVDHGWV